MTAAVIGLVACYVVLAALLLSLNLESAWPWRIKAGAIAVTAVFFVVAFLAIEAMLGWPTDGSPPERFQFHAALIQEPDPRSDDQGTIYLWLSPRDPGGLVSGPPRAHALPYSRELHRKVAQARTRLEQGRRVDGRTAPRAPADGFQDRSVQLELFEAPPVTPPPKTG